MVEEKQPWPKTRRGTIGSIAMWIFWLGVWIAGLFIGDLPWYWKIGYVLGLLAGGNALFSAVRNLRHFK